MTGKHTADLTGVSETALMTLGVLATLASIVALAVLLAFLFLAAGCAAAAVLGLLARPAKGPPGGGGS